MAGDSGCAVMKRMEIFFCENCDRAARALVAAVFIWGAFGQQEFPRRFVIGMMRACLSSAKRKIVNGNGFPVDAVDPYCARR